MGKRGRKRGAPNDVDATKTEGGNQRKIKKVETQESPTAKAAKKAKKSANEVFKRRATEMTEALREEFGDFPAEFNPEKPRRGAFEFTLIKEDASEALVWTGLKKGPPRKLKFPEVEVIIAAIKKEL